MFHAFRQARISIAAACAGVALAQAFVTGSVAAQAVIGSISYSGPGTSIQFGHSIASVGDIDGDGHADIVASANDAVFPTWDYGIVRVYSGADHSVLRQWTGDDPDDHLGYCVDSAGDVDGDGVQDVVAGAPGQWDGPWDIWCRGYVAVYSGGSGALLYDIPGLGQADRFGRVVAGLGDIDGDGLGDFAGASEVGVTDGVGSGYVRIFSGADGHELARIQGLGAGMHQLGRNVRPAGDFNADGWPDVVLIYLDHGGTSQGHMVVYSGAWIATGQQPDVLLDYAMASGIDDAVDAAGDVNQDGWDDVLLGTPFYDAVPQTGGWRVISGQDHSVLLDWAGSTPGNVEGTEVAGVGDLDLDGYPDLVVAASRNWYDPVGPVLAFSGDDGSVLFTCTPPPGCLDFGEGLAGVGDTNADGFQDWAAGSPFHGPITLYSPAGLWDDWGQGLGGSAGVPSLSGEGLLLGGDAMSLALTGSLPLQPVVLVMGLTALEEPFKGGVMVPQVDLVILAVTDGQGGQTWAAVWPSLASPLSAYFQAWQPDPQGVAGWAASNALRAQSP